MSKPHRSGFNRMAYIVPGLFIMLSSVAAVAQDKSDAPLEKQLHTWTDATGDRSIEAVLIAFANKIVTLEKPSGEILEVPFVKLSPKSKSLAKKLQRRIAKANKLAKKEHDDRPDAKGPPDADCPRCRGLGLVGPKKFEPWVITSTKKAKKANSLAVAESCPLCQKGVDPVANSIPFLSDPETNATNHEKWCQNLGHPMQLLQTRFLVIHSQLKPEESASIALALEKFEWMQQRTFGSLKLSNRNRGKDELFLFNDQASYSRFIDVFSKDKSDGADWEATKKLGFAIWGPTAFQWRQTTLQKMTNAAIYGTANIQISRATQGRAQSWLKVGFSSYFEKAVTSQNHCYMSGSKKFADRYRTDRTGKPIDQDGSSKLQLIWRNLQFHGNWDLGVEQLAKVDRVLPWKEVMESRLVDFTTTHDLQCKSMAGYLIQQPQKFIDLVELLAAGTDQFEAIKKAYGKDIGQLESDWRKFLSG